MAGPLTLRSLQYRLSATDAGFRSTMDGADRTLRNFGETARRSIRTLRNWSLAAGAAGTAVALAFKKINDETVKTATQIEDLNDKTGISRQRLQEMGYVAEQSSSSLDALGSGLTRMTRRTAEAAAGNQAYANSYRRLGIDIFNVDGTIRDTSELFLELAEAMEDIPDVGERSRIAFNLLGDSGYELLPMLSMGREEIERLMGESHELSKVLSDRTIRAMVQYDATMGRFRSTVTGVRNELATAVIPIFSQLASRTEQGARGVVAWIQENREFIAQAVIMGSVLVALATGLGLVVTGLSIGGKAIGVVSSLLGFLLSPMGLVIAGSVLLYKAWKDDWLGIQTITRGAVNYIREQWDRLMDWWEESDLGQAVKAWWVKIVAVWESDELTLSEKTVEIAKLIPGVRWVANFFVDVVKIWRDEKLTFPQKLVEIVKLLPGGQWLVGYVAEVKTIWDDEKLTFGEKVAEIAKLTPGVRWIAQFFVDVVEIWGDEDLTLPEKAAEIIRLIPGVSAIENMIKEIKDIWLDEDLTLPEKITETFRVVVDTVEMEAGGLAFLFGAAVTAPYLLKSLESAIRMIPGVIALASGSNLFKLTITGLVLSLAIFGWEFSNEDPEARENMLAEIDKVIDDIFPEGMATPIKGAVRFGVELSGAVFDAIKKGLDEGDWSDVFGATADVWRAGANIWVTLQLVAGTATALLNAIRAGLGLAAATQALGVAPVIGLLSVGVALVEAMQEEDYGGFAANMIAAILAGFLAAGLTGSVHAGVLVFTATLNWKVGETLVEGITETWQGRGQGTVQLPPPPVLFDDAYDDPSSPAYQRRLQQSEAIADARRREIERIAEEMRDREFVLTRRRETGLGDILDAIYQAEGGAEARVPYGATGFADAGHRFSRAENQAYFEALVEELALVEGTEAYYRAAAETTIMHYWRTFTERFPEIGEKNIDEIGSQMQRLFIEHLGAGYAPPEAHELNKNWVPNVTKILGLDDVSDDILVPPEGSLDRLQQAIAETVMDGLSVAGNPELLREAFDSLWDATQQDWSDGGKAAILAWAQGIYDSEEEARAAADHIATVVSRYLIGQSPPPEGPLSDIDEPNIGETWIQAIAREIEEEGGTLEAAIKVVADRMWNSMMGFLEERWPGAAEFLEGLMGDDWDPSDAIDNINNQVNDLRQQIEDLNNTSKQWTDGLVKGISDAIAYGRDLSDVFSNFLSMIASQFLQTRVIGPLLNSWLPGVLDGIPVFHSGGMILGGAGAMVMHDGGMIGGLRPDERLIIGQVGERVLSRRQNDRFERMLDEDRQSGEPQEVNVNLLIQAVDAKSFVDLAQRNPEAITTVVLGDIGKNGRIRKAIQAVSRGG